MPPLRRFCLVLAAAGCVLLAACTIMPQQQPLPPPPADTPANDRDLAAAEVMANTFQTMQRLTQAAPAEQAEIVSGARDAFQRDPRGEAQLRYALLLATPGHPARNIAMAQKLLRELAAHPEALVPVERAVVLVELAQLDREVDLSTDNEQLQGAALRNDQQRTAADQRRLQTQVEENARLRKELEAAQAKLDAVATIERNVTERRTANDIGSGVGAGAGTGRGAGTGTARGGTGATRGGTGAARGGAARGSGGGSAGGGAAPVPASPGGTSSGPVTRPPSSSGNAGAPGGATGPAGSGGSTGGSASGGAGSTGGGSTGAGGGGSSGGGGGSLGNTGQ